MLTGLRDIYVNYFRGRVVFGIVIMIFFILLAFSVHDIVIRAMGVFGALVIVPSGVYIIDHEF